MAKPSIDEIVYPLDAVTFPRSGHHYLERLLNAYFGDDWRYNEPYELRGEYATSHMSKNHDFLADYEVGEGRRLLVQIRSPMAAIASRYEMHVAELHRAIFDAWETQVTHRCRCDCKQAWLSFCSRQAVEYARFTRRWIGRQLPDRLILQYEDMMEDRESALSMVLEHMGVDPDCSEISRAVKQVGFIELRRVTRFRYYDPIQFGRVRLKILSLLADPSFV